MFTAPVFNYVPFGQKIQKSDDIRFANEIKKKKASDQIQDCYLLSTCHQKYKPVSCCF